jgi:ubiquinone/menaquinone biosynthesis C-methylase UbiE
MKKTFQKEIFLAEEGNAWFLRNHTNLTDRKFDDTDPVTSALIKCIALNERTNYTLLEIGCGEGRRLEWIRKHLQIDCQGIEPSELAVKAAIDRGIIVQQGTADQLPYASESFDYVVFGFCLYLCDREDLFRIAMEADRVLKTESWLIIHDFFADNTIQRDYHHREGLKSYKADYRRLFDWHPAYTCLSHEITHHVNGQFTDEPNEWVALSVLRKNSRY